MRLFINAMLAFAIVGFAAGMLPVSAQYLTKLQAMKTDLAVAEAAREVKLRPSFPN